MLNLEDKRWRDLTGSDRKPCDPRPLLLQLEASPYANDAWESLSKQLVDQGRVGDASYASVPYLNRIASMIGGAIPWHLTGLVARIELARTQPCNPPLPKWINAEYTEAIHHLALNSLRAMSEPQNAQQLRGMLSILCIWHGRRVYASAFLEYSEEEWGEFFLTESGLKDLYAPE